MDQGTAQVLFEEGATLVFLDMPEGTEFGMDFDSWTVGPKFRGMKMIPPGIHFVYYSAVDARKEKGPRIGFFYNFKKRDVLVKKWNKELEDVSMEIVSEEELARFEANKKELDRFLAPYPYESYKKWISLTNHMTEDVVAKLHPECGTVCSMAQFISEASTTESRKRDAQVESMETNQAKNSGQRNKGTIDDQMLPKMKTIKGTEVRYSKISKRKFPEGATPSEVTKCSMDSSYQLETILKERYSHNHSGLLGEIQFAFLCFLIGQNYDAFEAWKRLVHLLCSSDEVLRTHPSLFIDFISVLHFQEFFSNLDCEEVDATLRLKGLRFREHLTHKFGWDFTSEPDEYAPAIVDCAD